MVTVIDPKRSSRGGEREELPYPVITCDIPGAEGRVITVTVWAVFGQRYVDHVPQSPGSAQ